MCYSEGLGWAEHRMGLAMESIDPGWSYPALVHRRHDTTCDECTGM